MRASHLTLSLPYLLAQHVKKYNNAKRASKDVWNKLLTVFNEFGADISTMSEDEWEMVCKSIYGPMHNGDETSQKGHEEICMNAYKVEKKT